MRLAYTVFVVSVLMGSFAYAESLPNGLQKSVCSPGTTSKPSASFGSADGAKAEFTKLVGSTNFCTNEVVRMSGFSFVDEVTCICTKPEDLQKVGCERADQRQPTVTTIIDRSLSSCKTDRVVISKCVKDAEAAYKQVCGSGRDLTKITPTPSPTTTPPPSVPPVPAGALPQSIQQVLQGEFDKTNPAARDKAVQILQNAGMTNVSAKNVVEKIGSGDITGAQVIVKAELNPEILKQIKTLTPAGGTPVVDVGPPDPNATNGPQNTGFGNPYSGTTNSSQGYGGGNGSPFSSLISGFASGFSGGGSPFANVTPAPKNYFANTPTQGPPSNPFGNIVSPSTGVNQDQVTQTSLLQPSTPVEQSSVVQKLLQALRGSTPPPPPAPSPVSRPVATLLAQPHTIAKGNPVVLSWSSVGMKTDAPCTVQLGAYVLAQLNEGSKLVPTDATSAQGEMTFTLHCTAQSGESIEQTASVDIQ